MKSEDTEVRTFNFALCRPGTYVNCLTTFHAYDLYINYVCIVEWRGL